jgi:aromatic-L-amino-acid decarboxylase
VNNYRDWGIQLGRRFRALKLWFVLRSFGIKGLQDKLRYHISLAKQLEKEIRSDGRFEILAPVNFNTICFRYKPTDANLTDSELNEINKNLLDKINASGFAFLSHTTLKNKFTLRFSIGQTNTTSEDVLNTWKLIQNLVGEIK